MIVWPVVNVEVWDIGRPMPRQVLPPPTGVTQLPDVPHWGWHEYGMRVGFWRMKALLDELKIVPSLSINARVCLDYPRVARAARDSGWEFMGHSYDQRPIHLEPDQAGMIRRSVKVLREFSGRRPVGWMDPALRKRWTHRVARRAGIQYIADWFVTTSRAPAHARARQTLPYPGVERHRHDGGAASRGGGIRVPLDGHLQCLWRGPAPPKVMASAAPLHFRRCTASSISMRAEAIERRRGASWNGCADTG